VRAEWNYKCKSVPILTDGAHRAWAVYPRPRKGKGETMAKRFWTFVINLADALYRAAGVRE
jgi:hypothetical protein